MNRTLPNDLITVRMVLSPDSETVPLYLWYNVLIRIGVSSGVIVREKAYGLLIKGPKEEVERVVSTIRNIDAHGIFITEAAPPIKGHDVFSGFLQLSGEILTLPLISNALRESSGKGELKVRGKLVRCRYVGLIHRPLALLINQGNSEVKVRCPELMKLYGFHACASCPYGDLTYP